MPFPTTLILVEEDCSFHLFGILGILNCILLIDSVSIASLVPRSAGLDSKDTWYYSNILPRQRRPSRVNTTVLPMLSTGYIHHHLYWWWREGCCPQPLLPCSSLAWTCCYVDIWWCSLMVQQCSCWLHPHQDTAPGECNSWWTQERRWPPWR